MIGPISISDSDGMRIYQRSLSFLLIVAAHELFPEADIVVDHSLTLNGFYCRVEGRPPFSDDELALWQGRLLDTCSTCCYHRVRSDRPGLSEGVMREQAAFPRHIVWSTDRLDLTDPFQRRWYIRQVLLHGRAEDVRALDLAEVAASLDQVDLPPDLYRLWKDFLEVWSHARR